MYYKQRNYDSLEENSTFQKITNFTSNIASYNNQLVSIEVNNTIENGTTLNDEPTVDENQENKITLQRIIEIITQHNEKFGIMLKGIFYL